MQETQRRSEEKIMSHITTKSPIIIHVPVRSANDVHKGDLIELKRGYAAHFFDFMKPENFLGCAVEDPKPWGSSGRLHIAVDVSIEANKKIILRESAVCKSRGRRKGGRKGK